MKAIHLFFVLSLSAICIGADKGVATFFSGDDTDLGGLVCMPGNGHLDPNPAKNGKPKFNFAAMSTASPYWRNNGFTQCNGGKSPFSGPTTDQVCNNYLATNKTRPGGPSCETARKGRFGDICDQCFEIKCIGTANGGSNPCKPGNPSTIVRIYDVCPSNHPNNICKARMHWDNGNANNSCQNTSLNAFDLYKGAFNEIADTGKGFIRIDFKKTSCSRVKEINY